MQLTLDRGNTTLDVMLHPEGDAASAAGGADGAPDPLPFRARLDPAAPDALGEFLAGRPVTAAIGVSVVDAGLASPKAWLMGRGIPLLHVPGDLPCPMATRYRTMDTLGADRWVAAWAAHRSHGAAIVVDCGTAVTVDGVDAEGTFLGGAIAPGPSALAAGLGSLAPGLPKPAGDWEMPPRASANAVGAGLGLGLCGLIERLVSEVRGAMSDSDPALVITGGAASVYLRHGRLPCAHVPDLVHQGLRGLLEQHRG